MMPQQRICKQRGLSADDVSVQDWACFHRADERRNVVFGKTYI